MQRPRKSATYWFGLHGLFSLSSYTTQDRPPMGGTTMGWAHNIHHQSRKYVTSLPVGQAAGGIFSIEVSLLKMTLACSKLI